ncbi:MAG: hypothetical protein NC402_06100 [Prevotella sp.]|nr:hypothetical protein [Prevotella sp.]MCM1075287.1 hypothetical protein [Ruminococcus sp.]
MKKLKFLSLCFAAGMALSVTAVSCNNSNTTNDTNKETKGKNAESKTKSLSGEAMIDSLTGMSAAQAAASDSLPVYTSEDFPTPESAISYLEANSDKAFAKIKSIADITRKAMTGSQPTDAEIKLLQDPNSVDPKFMDAVLMLMQWTYRNEITKAQEEKLTKFAAEHKEGMENLGLLMQAAMMSDPATAGLMQ